jgi:hypothetical protein
MDDNPLRRYVLRFVVVCLTLSTIVGMGLAADRLLHNEPLRFFEVVGPACALVALILALVELRRLRVLRRSTRLTAGDPAA